MSDKKAIKIKTQKKQQTNWKKFWKLGAEEFNTQFFGVTEEGELTIREGNYIYNLNDIVKKYGTPTEIVFPFILEERLEDLHDYFLAYMKIGGYKGKFYSRQSSYMPGNNSADLPNVLRE